MLKKIRIEVEAASPDECIVELTKYEHALQAAEEERYGLARMSSEAGVHFANWGKSINQRSFFNEELGRVVVEEVIEFDLAASSDPGEGPAVYHARRVVRYTRIDLRMHESAVPPPRVVDHWEDRSSFPEPDEFVPSYEDGEVNVPGDGTFGDGTFGPAVTGDGTGEQLPEYDGLQLRQSGPRA